MNVKGKNDIPYIMENKTCLTPPTRYYNWDWFPGNSVAYIDSQFLENGYPRIASCSYFFPELFLRDKPAWYIFWEGSPRGYSTTWWIMANGFDFTWSIPLKRQCHGGNDDNPSEPAVPDFQGKSDGHPWCSLKFTKYTSAHNGLPTSLPHYFKRYLGIWVKLKL